MKNDSSRLSFHSQHKRPMAGCFPLFLLLAALATAGAISLVKVTSPRPFRALGRGVVQYRDDELTRFQVRQRSVRPLRLPAYADPAANRLQPEHELPLCRPVELQPAPPLPITAESPDSAVLESVDLLSLPPLIEEEAEHD